jgi:long-chain fatty acid transport protein
MRSSRRPGAITALAALVAACVLALAGEARATNGAQPIAYGAKQAGRAGAETGVADDAISGAVNPAALGEVPGLRVDAGLTLFLGRDRYVNALNDHLDSGWPPSLVPTVGISWDPTGPAADAPEGASWRGGPFRIGLDIFIPAGTGGSDQLKTSVFPGGEEEAESFYVLDIAPTFAWRVNDWITLGVQPQLLYMPFSDSGLVGTRQSSSGLVYLYRNSNGQTLNPPQPVLVNGQQVHYSDFFAQANTADTALSSRIDTNGDSGFGLGGALGIFLRPLEQLSIGLAYRFEGHIPNVHGTARVDGTQAFAAASSGNFGGFGATLLNAYLPDGGQKGYVSSYKFKIDDFRIPAQLSVGVGWRPLPELLLAFDFKWIQWSSAFDQEKITLTGGTNNDINAVSGSSNLESTQLLNWHDQLVYALGTAYRATDWMVLRGGFNYGKNPIPAATAGITTGDVEFHAAVGAGFYVDRFDFDVAYVYAFPKSVTIDKSDTSPDLNGTSVRSEQHAIYLQASVSF